MCFRDLLLSLTTFFESFIYFMTANFCMRRQTDGTTDKPSHGSSLPENKNSSRFCGKSILKTIALRLRTKSRLSLALLKVKVD